MLFIFVELYHLIQLQDYNRINFQTLQAPERATRSGAFFGWTLFLFLLVKKLEILCSCAVNQSKVLVINKKVTAYNCISK